jgi:UDP-glucose 4-epimerase
MSTGSGEYILVLGGAGYIGSHAVIALKERGYRPVVYDNFIYGNRDIAALLDVPIIEAEIADRAALKAAFKQYNPCAVMHFAAFAYVGESVTEPAKYYDNNLATTLVLLDEMRQAKINNFIFSSTCATYGVPARFPIVEDLPQAPVNPYGRTKLMVEQVLKDFDHAYGFRSVIFRYFNAAGAHPNIAIGERHNPETHLIPLALAATEPSTPLKVFGDDYDTPDGTCIRDYIHVSDIADAHVRGLDFLLREGRSDIFNIGTGNGYSVREVISTIERIAKKQVHFVMNPRRAGDPPKLVAGADKIKTVLGWQPRYSDLDTIIETAWNWYLKETKQ